MKNLPVMSWLALSLLACSNQTPAADDGNVGGGTTAAKSSSKGGVGGSSSGGGGGGGSSSSSSGSSSGGSAAGTGGSSSGGAATSSVSGGGFTFNAQISDANSQASLGSADVCLLAQPGTCTPTDANGNVTINGLAASGDGITAALTGYATGIWPITPTGNVMGWIIFLRSNTRMAALAGKLGTTFGSTTGAIVFQANDGSGSPMSGVSVAVAGGTVGYFAGDGSGLDPTLTATTANGGGFIFGVPPGTVGVTFSGSGLVCVRSGAEGWPGSGGETMTVPVRGGMLTRAAAACQ